MKPAFRQLCRVMVLCLTVLVTESIAKPDKPVSSPPPIDFSELEKLVSEELKEKNTPGAVITVVSGDQVVYQKAVEAGKPAVLRPLFNNVAMWPAGSMWSNSKDLSRWVIAFMNDGRVDGKQLLSSSLINQMAQHHMPVPGELTRTTLTA